MNRVTTALALDLLNESSAGQRDKQRVVQKGVLRMDAREFPRAPMTAPVKFFQWNELREAEATEISANGLFLRTRDVLSEEAMITVRLTLPGLKRAFTVLGKVVRTAKGGLFTPPGMGIRFVDLRPPEKAAISSYVERRGLAMVPA